jgi:hypothetical protein
MHLSLLLARGNIKKQDIRIAFGGMIKAGIYRVVKVILTFLAACILILPPKAILPIMLNFNHTS